MLENNYSKQNSDHAFEMCSSDRITTDYFLFQHTQGINQTDQLSTSINNSVE